MGHGCTQREKGGGFLPHRGWGVPGGPARGPEEEQKVAAGVRGHHHADDPPLQEAHGVLQVHGRGRLGGLLGSTVMALRGGGAIRSDPRLLPVALFSTAVNGRSPVQCALSARSSSCDSPGRSPNGERNSTSTMYSCGATKKAPSFGWLLFFCRRCFFVGVLLALSSVFFRRLSMCCMPASGTALQMTFGGEGGLAPGSPLICLWMVATVLGSLVSSIPQWIALESWAGSGLEAPYTQQRVCVIESLGSARGHPACQAGPHSD